MSAYKDWYDHVFSLESVKRTLPDKDRYLEHIGKYAGKRVVFLKETLTYLIAKGIFSSAIFSPFIISSLPHVRRQVRTVHSRILSLNATNFFHVPDSTRSARSKVANAVRRGVAAHELDDDKDTY